MHIVCSDLEGVFVPEIWIKVAERTGIEELRLTTRDISDYDVLMKKRIGILKTNNLKLPDITEVIDTMEPLEGALEFMNWLRSVTQIIILSDTFVQFAGPLMRKLGWPTLFCHTLSIDSDGYIIGYNLRQQESKRSVVEALKNLNFKVIAMGDSYNDITMLNAADKGILFHPPDKVKDEFPEFQVSFGYDTLKTIISDTLVVTY